MIRKDVGTAPDVTGTHFPGWTSFKSWILRCCPEMCSRNGLTLRKTEIRNIEIILSFPDFSFLFHSVGAEWKYSHTFATVESVSPFKAPSWQRMDIVFHSATHSVTPLPFPPQGLLSWELACQTETVWRLGGLEVSDLTGIWRRWRGERAALRLSAKMRIIKSVFTLFKSLSEEFLSLGSSGWYTLANRSELAFLFSSAYDGSLYLFNLC